MRSARRGAIDELVPRTPAEEALIYLATRPGYVGAARDHIDLFNLGQIFDALPVAEDDEKWEEVLGDLTSDVDIERFWMSNSQGQEDPANPINRYLGMGDYRPQAWHRLFERAIPENDVSDDYL